MEIAKHQVLLPSSASCRCNASIWEQLNQIEIEFFEVEMNHLLIEPARTFLSCTPENVCDPSL